MPKVVKGAKDKWGVCFCTVLLDAIPRSLSYWNNIIASGCLDGDIITLDAITGSRKVVLSGHTDAVNCVTFSSDGRLLASGADDNTVKLWDMQTGWVVMTFHGHTECVQSVSISVDSTKIVSGSEDQAIHLWNIQTGECLRTISQQDTVDCTSFSPINPQCIISVSGGKVWEWDFNGQQIQPICNGIYITFSPNCAKFALCDGDVVTVENSDSGVIETQIHLDTGNTQYWCFSPDSRLIAAAAGSIAYVWDITSSDSHLVGTVIRHDADIWSLVFSSPSSLISASYDGSIRFWQISVLPTDSAVTNSESTPPPLSQIMSVGLQVRPGIAISSDERGVVKTWDISTGFCKESFQTPAGGHPWRDARLVDGRLIVVWCNNKRIYIWSTNKDDPPKILATLSFNPRHLRISGDGSKVFCLFEGSIQVWSTHTGEPVGEVKLELEQGYYLDPLQMDDSKIWFRLRDFSTQGWDFSISNSPPVPVSDEPMERPLLDFIASTWQQTKESSLIKNKVTGKEVFQLSGRFSEPREIRWNGQYLVAGYQSGEVLILDFHHLYP